jgi:hypothetical protein
VNCKRGSDEQVLWLGEKCRPSKKKCYTFSHLVQTYPLLGKILKNEKIPILSHGLREEYTCTIVY